MTTDADYVAVDLTSLCNAGLEVLEGLRQPPVGELAFHGIPFVIGGEEANDCFIRLDPGSGPVPPLGGH